MLTARKRKEREPEKSTVSRDRYTVAHMLRADTCSLRSRSTTASLEMSCGRAVPCPPTTVAKRDHSDK